MKRFQFNYLALLPAVILTSYLVVLNVVARTSGERQSITGVLSGGRWMSFDATIFYRGWPLHYQQLPLMDEERAQSMPWTDVDYFKISLNALIVLLSFALALFICQKALNRFYRR